MDAIKKNANKLLASQLRRPEGAVIGRTMLHLLNRWNRHMNAKALAALRLQPGDRVLEIGFGGGDLLAGILENTPGGHVEGIDWSDTAVKHCRRRFDGYIGSRRLDIRQATIEDEIPRDGCFDKICSVNTLFFWKDLAAVFRACHRLLCVPGTLVLCSSTRESLLDETYAAEVFHLHDKDAITAGLVEAGFGIVDDVSVSHPSGDYFCTTANKERG